MHRPEQWMHRFEPFGKTWLHCSDRQFFWAVLCKRRKLERRTVMRSMGPWAHTRALCSERANHKLQLETTPPQKIWLICESSPKVMMLMVGLPENPENSFKKTLCLLDDHSFAWALRQWCPNDNLWAQFVQMWRQDISVLQPHWQHWSHEHGTPHPEQLVLAKRRLELARRLRASRRTGQVLLHHCNPRAQPGPYWQHLAILTFDLYLFFLL